VKGQGLLLAVVSAVVLAAIVTGFLVLGTPGEARKGELDRTRVENLRDISNGIFYTWNKGGHEPPPASLEAFMDGRPLKAHMKDPVTKKPYGYRDLGGGKFELCATFDTAVGEDDADYGSDWAHPAGPYCFRFDVRRQLGPEGGP
jgi:hypothetical protein